MAAHLRCDAKPEHVAAARLMYIREREIKRERER